MTTDSHGDRRPPDRARRVPARQAGADQPGGRRACRPAPGGAPPDCAARSSPSSPGSASPGTPGLSRAARSTRASRCSTRSPRTLRLDAVERGPPVPPRRPAGRGRRRRTAPTARCRPRCSRSSTPITFPACVLTERFDLIAWNQVYAALFPGICEAPAGERNTLLVNLTAPSCCSPLQDQDQHCLALVGQLRAAYGRHVGDPAWTHFIRRLEAVSPAFAAGLGVTRRGAADQPHQALPPPDRRPHHHHVDQLRGHRRPRRPHGRLHPRRRAERAGARPAGRRARNRRPLPLLVHSSTRTSAAGPDPLTPSARMLSRMDVTTSRL